jgi:hypothetical protein
MKGKPFVFVKSTGKNRWRGVIIDYERVPTDQDYIIVLILINSGGKMPRKRLALKVNSWKVVPDVSIPLDTVPTAWFRK